MSISTAFAVSEKTPLPSLREPPSRKRSTKTRVEIVRCAPDFDDFFSYYHVVPGLIPQLVTWVGDREQRLLGSNEQQCLRQREWRRQRR